MNTQKTILINASDAGSLINFRGKLIESLSADGFDVHVSAPCVPKTVAADLRKRNATVHEIPMSRTGMNPISDLIYLWALFRLTKKIRPTQMLNYTIKPNIWGAFAGRLAGVETASMVTGLGLGFIPSKGRSRRALQLLMQRLYGFATAFNYKVIFQNRDDLQDFIAAGCLADPCKAAVVNGSGVDLTHYAPTPLHQRPSFLMISRLLVNKGVREFAQAAIELMSKRQDCRFTLVGSIDDGPDRILREELDGWIEAGIDYRGSMADVRLAIADASVFVLPSYREGTPRSVLEAMAMGRAIITTDVPGCRETVDDNVNGLLVPAKDVDALVHAMEKLADDEQLRYTFGVSSLDIAIQKYDVHKVNKALREHLYF
jgi:glycosyltransferase involved in cell wall biosynthesis